MNRRAAKRDANEAQIVKALRMVGATVSQLDEPVDLVVGFRGENHLLEIKLPVGPRGGTNGSELTDSQRVWFGKWKGSATVVRSVDDALRAIGAIKGDE